MTRLIKCMVWIVGLMLFGLLLTGSTQAETAQDDFSCANITEIPQIECEALVALYEEASGRDWVGNTEWLGDETPCNWYGITCKDGHIILLELDELNDWGLVGALPAEIGNLSQLSVLSLDYNRLNSLPEEIGNLTQLRELDLSRNQIETLPEEIGNLTQLRELDLSYNLDSCVLRQL